MTDTPKKLTDVEIEATIEQTAAMSKIADGYNTTEAEKEIYRKCFKGEMTWNEGFKAIMNLPCPEEE